MEEQITLEEIVVLARHLPLDDKVRLIEIIAPEIEREARGTRPSQRDRRDSTPPDDSLDLPYNPVESWRTFTYSEEN